MNETMENYLILVVFDDGEARRYVKVATCPFKAIVAAKDEIAKQVNLATVLGIQVDRLDYPYFM